ncbi:hypothetical protein PaecuDRAFT_0913 [Paenibacillus curdlanolyticus YK9]|uniref:Uncharacterized protein n=1 Tax=Paenibacillus curdlanolyticus YK9 TaxID=717606 RepID=E0I5J1_9BACL|nr:hypothetical protein PaecuDRAFT_0913 [Paenibacillus curdlanolyticus YK9]
MTQIVRIITFQNLLIVEERDLRGKNKLTIIDTQECHIGAITIHIAYWNGTTLHL